MLNDKKTTWITDFKSNPEHGKACYILVEDDVVYKESDPKWIENHVPCVRIAEYVGNPGRAWKLLDYDPETEEEYLRTNNFSVIFWRYVE